MAKIDTQFMTNRLKNHTLWGRTYLYSPYKGVPPPGRNADRNTEPKTRQINVTRASHAASTDCTPGQTLGERQSAAF